MRPFLKILLCLLLIFSALPAVGASGPEATYQKARDAYYTLQNSARKQLYRDQWQKVLELFEQVHERYPGSSRADDALFMRGKTTAKLYKISRLKTDASDAIDLYRDVARRFPGSSLSDDALLHAGTLLEEILGDLPEAWRVYRQLVDAYPKGDMASQAEQRLKRLAAYAPVPKKRAAELTSSKPEPKTAAASDVGGEHVQLSSVRFWSNPGYTRVVLDLSGVRDFSTNFLPAEPSEGAPPRIYLDIASADLGPGMAAPTVVDDGLLKQIRTGQPRAGIVRVVLDLESVHDYTVFPLGDPYRIVIDISGQKQETATIAPSPEPASVKPPPTPAVDGKDEIAKVLEQAPREQAMVHIPEAPVSSRMRRIVVDAGHGGRDPGAIGPGGTYEKTVTLALAKKLAKKLESSLGCEVVLTRSRDIYLPLEERTAIANKVGADLFISLHANANKSRKPYGVETYYLNFSKNDKAAALAARENGTSLKEVSDLELILFDLMANAKINESSRLAAEIQKGLVSGLGRHYSNIKDMGVRQGPFYVLLGATMPSVLIETAFISNPREEKRLASGTYQERTADAIARSVRRYAENNKLIAAK